MHAVVPIAAANEGVQGSEVSVKRPVRYNSFPKIFMAKSFPVSGLYRFNYPAHDAP